MRAFLHGHVTATPPRALVRADELAAWAADSLAPLLLPTHEPARTGLFVATSDAGAAASIGLWAEALAQGPGFANPRDFPWTLASSPAGHIAATLPVRGPTYTLVGGGDAATAALWHALDCLASGQIDHALVVALDLTPALHPDAGSAALAALSLCAPPLPAGAWQVATAEGPGMTTPGTFAAPLLATLCRAHDRGEALVVGDPDEGWIALSPAPSSPR